MTMIKYHYLLLILVIIFILTGCSNNNPVNQNGNTETDSLIFYHDSISNFAALNGIDTVFRDTTILRVRIKYDLWTNDKLPDSLVWSGNYISGYPSYSHEIYGKYNEGHYEYLWAADSAVNYLHIGFDVNYLYPSQLAIKMYNIKIYKVY